jgi:hypothetical protein
MSPPATHLRDLIDRQPCALVRIGVDGRVLAANRAAMALLGASDVEAIRAVRIPDRLAADDRVAWEAFVSRVAAGAADSINCELDDLRAERRFLEFAAVPLLDHPDGVPSILANARDRSETLGLEKALADSRVEHDAVHESMRRLESMAAVGRLALDLGAQLQAAASSVDRRSRELLERSALTAPERTALEALRREAVAVASLARQMAQRDGTS